MLKVFVFSLLRLTEHRIRESQKPRTSGYMPIPDISALALFFVLLAGVPSAADTGALAFKRDDAIWVAYLGGSGARKVGPGAMPDLSPDGRQVVFVTNEGDTPQGPVRRLAVASLTDGRITIFDLPGKNCIRPVWSPNGKKIAFYLISFLLRVSHFFEFFC